MPSSSKKIIIITFILSRAKTLFTLSFKDRAIPAMLHCWYEVVAGAEKLLETKQFPRFELGKKSVLSIFQSGAGFSIWSTDHSLKFIATAFKPDTGVPSARVMLCGQLFMNFLGEKKRCKELGYLALTL